MSCSQHYGESGHIEGGRRALYGDCTLGPTRVLVGSMSVWGARSSHRIAYHNPNKVYGP